MHKLINIFGICLLVGFVIFLYVFFHGPLFFSPFYLQPKTLVSTIPGTIVRTEKVEQSVVPDANAWKILYVSTDFQTKKPIVVSGVVFIPKSSLASGSKRPIVAWAHGTTGVATQCAPSLLSNGGAGIIPGLSTFIKSGDVVVATDYPGLGTAGTLPYLIGESAAYAVLDSVRAALNLPQANAENKFVVWGHSQGGHASLFTGQLAKGYAPELNLVGVAATAPATDLAKLFTYDLGTTPGNALASLAFVAWSKLFAGADLFHIMKLQSIPIAQNIAVRCVNNKYALSLDYPEAALLNKLGFLAKEPSKTEPWKTILRTNSPTGATITVPMLITQGSADTIVDPKVTQSVVDNLCQEGKTIVYHVLPGVGHLPAGFDSVSIIAPWVQERFNGVTSVSNCQ